MTAAQIMEKTGKRRLLALDGGGIRGLITVEVLAEIERVLGDGDDAFVLADAFDYVAGTSTGAIIATCIARGMRVDEIRAFFLVSGEDMFDKASIRKRWLSNKYEDRKLASKLKAVLDEETTLGSDTLRTLLMMVMRNATTDSPWPLCNNPDAMYNRRSRTADGKACNLDLPLWQLVRASTAAPVYFPPEVIDIGGEQDFVMVDGGVTTYNNPAFLLFLMATAAAYRLQWTATVDDMLVVSVGTGTSPKANADLAPDDMNVVYNASSVPSALMFAALNQQDLLCRIFGDCRHGDALDRELGSLVGAAGQGPVDPKRFTYLRYNAELTDDWLRENGLTDIEPAHVQRLDSTQHMQELQRVGRRVAAQVCEEHFAGFLMP